MNSIACCLFSLMVAGCATSVSKISSDGAVEQVIFPDIQKDAWLKEGIFPNTENLTKVKPGTTKDQVYALLGSPHFKEGFGQVKEWDYIFNFEQEGTGILETCQFKIIYNQKMLLQETFWKPETCVNYAQQKTQQPVVLEKVIERTTAATDIYHVKMNSDGFFDFDKSEMHNLRPGGKERLDKLLSSIIEKDKIISIKIVGHTDRLGTDEYNFKLSHSRANAIKSYLAKRDVPIEKMTAYGMGEEQPLVGCAQTKRDSTLISCLEPNRRFEIDIETLK